jgi:hypothetical protein
LHRTALDQRAGLETHNIRHLNPGQKPSSAAKISRHIPMTS